MQPTNDWSTKRMELPKDDTLRDEQSRAQLRSLAREVLSDAESLVSHHLALTRIEIEKAKGKLKLSSALLSLAILLGLVSFVTLVRAVVMSLAQANDWTAATAEWVTGLAILLLAIIGGSIGYWAFKQVAQLPQSISKQWKEEWQWLRKNL